MNISRRNFLASSVVLVADADVSPVLPAAGFQKTGALGKCVGSLPPGRYDSHIHVMRGAPAPQKFRAALTRAGIAGGCVFSTRPDGWDMNTFPLPDPEKAMDDVIAWCSASPTLYPFYWIDPGRADALELVDRALEKGIYGFKVIRSDAPPCAGRALEVYRRIAAAGKPLTFHSGILWDGCASSDNFRPAKWEPLLDVPHLRFALAHVSWPWTDECIAVYGKMLNAMVRRGENVPEMFIDTTPGTPKIYRHEVLSRLFGVGYDVKDHVQFGADCGTDDYNFSWVRDWMNTDYAIYAEIGLGAEARDSIYRKSLERYLFGGSGGRIVPTPDGTKISR